MKKIIIRSEYECYPLWEAKSDGLKNFSAHDLDIPNDLAQRIEDWGDKFEATYVSDDPASSGFKNNQDKHSFIEEGKSLSQQLRNAMKEDASIEYRMLDGQRLNL